MKSFGIAVTLMVMLALLAGKVYSQNYNIHDIDICKEPYRDPNSRLTKECCDKLNQHIGCLCDYAHFYPRIGYTANEVCRLDWRFDCPDM